MRRGIYVVHRKVSPASKKNGGHRMQKRIIHNLVLIVLDSGQTQILDMYTSD